ncbi:hypothetical protein [Enterobacter phage vB-EclM_KMB17]|nr:hypothetical protein [Enterobacter phage vB-EclM_KMB17]
MKRCEIIGNIFTVVTLGALGTSIFGWPFLSNSELVSSVVLTLVAGTISFVMDKIANDSN